LFRGFTLTRPADLKSKTKQLVFKPKTIADEKLSEDFKDLCLQNGLEIHDLLCEAINLAFQKHHFPPKTKHLTFHQAHLS
jgi:hypothetical protein